MARAPRDIETAFRRAWWRARLIDLRAGSVWIVGIAAFIGVIIYWIATPESLVAQHRGEVIAPLSTPGGKRLVRGVTGVRVQLEDGRIIDASIPDSYTYSLGDTVWINEFHRDWWPRHATFSFSETQPG